MADFLDVTSNGIEPRHYKLKEAATRLNCSKSTIRRLIERNQLETIGEGGLLRVTRVSIERYEHDTANRRRRSS